MMNWMSLDELVNELEDRRILSIEEKDYSSFLLIYASLFVAEWCTGNRLIITNSIKKTDCELLPSFFFFIW